MVTYGVMFLSAVSTDEMNLIRYKNLFHGHREKK